MVRVTGVTGRSAGGQPLDESDGQSDRSDKERLAGGHKSVTSH